MSTPEMSLFHHDERLRACHVKITAARSAFRKLGQCYNEESHEAYEYWWTVVFRELADAQHALEEAITDGPLAP